MHVILDINVAKKEFVMTCMWTIARIIDDCPMLISPDVNDQFYKIKNSSVAKKAFTDVTAINELVTTSYKCLDSLFLKSRKNLHSDVQQGFCKTLLDSLFRCYKFLSRFPAQNKTMISEELVKFYQDSLSQIKENTDLILKNIQEKKQSLAQSQNFDLETPEIKKQLKERFASEQDLAQTLRLIPAVYSYNQQLLILPEINDTPPKTAHQELQLALNILLDPREALPNICGTQAQKIKLLKINLQRELKGHFTPIWRMIVIVLLTAHWLEKIQNEAPKNPAIVSSMTPYLHPLIDRVNPNFVIQQMANFVNANKCTISTPQVLLAKLQAKYKKLLQEISTVETQNSKLTKVKLAVIDPLPEVQLANLFTKIIITPKITNLFAVPTLTALTYIGWQLYRNPPLLTWKLKEIVTNQPAIMNSIWNVADFAINRTANKLAATAPTCYKRSLKECHFDPLSRIQYFETCKNIIGLGIVIVFAILLKVSVPQWIFVYLLENTIANTTNYGINQLGLEKKFAAYFSLREETKAGIKAITSIASYVTAYNLSYNLWGRFSSRKPLLELDCEQKLTTRVGTA
jgi:hypothetical protein